MFLADGACTSHHGPVCHGKRWDELLPIAPFPGFPLLGPWCSSSFLPHLYQPPELTSPATGVERLKLKAQVRVENTVQDPGAAGEVPTETKPWSPLTMDEHWKSWAWVFLVLWGDPEYWDKYNWLWELLFPRKRQMQHFFKKDSWRTLTRLLKMGKLCCL